MKKAIAVIAYYDGLRTSELVKLSFSDVDVSQNNITVYVKTSKTDPHGKEKFHFVIPRIINDAVCSCAIVEKYMDAVIGKTGRFFRNFNIKANNYAKQPMGINSIAAIPKFIASYLHLENPEKYTGHCFRRSSAIALADSGDSRLTLKRQFRWKSDTVAEGYLAGSKTLKSDVASALTINSNLFASNSEKSRITKQVNITNCSNVVINL